MAERRDRVIIAIGVAKLAKGVLLLALGVAILALGPIELVDQLAREVARIGLHPGASYVRGALGKLLRLSNDDAIKIGAALVVYGTLFGTEGTALVAGWHWAHGFAIAVTGSFIPLEIYELVQHPNVARAVLLALNAAIVVYLVVRLKRR